MSFPQQLADDFQYAFDGGLAGDNFRHGDNKAQE